MKVEKPKIGLQEPRTINAEMRAVSEDSRTIELSFSSELPYNRWFGAEILSHDDNAINLARLLDVGTVLFTHGKDPNYGKMPIAKIEKAWVDPAEKKARAQITFDDDPDSEKVYQKVKNGFIKGVSVGYTVNSWEEVMPGKKSANGRFTGPASIAISWEPIEISIEPTPADPVVGVGRSAEEESSNPPAERSDEINQDRQWFAAIGKKILNQEV